MPKREKCRNCGAKLKHDKTSDQYDPEYCSGKCRKLDGSEPYVKSAEEQAMVVKEAKLIAPATFKDYEKNVGGRYVRRFEPEKLNWGDPMSAHDLLQAGFRANREPIQGDWDYEGESVLYSCKKCNRIVKRLEKDMPESDEVYCMACLLEKNAHEPIPGDNDWQALKAKAKSLGIKTHAKKRPQIEADIQEEENKLSAIADHAVKVALGGEEL